MYARLNAALIGAALIITGCSGGNDITGADVDKTPAQVADEAKQAETPELEAAVASYEQAITDAQAELAALQKQIEDAGSKAVGDLMEQAEAEQTDLATELDTWKGEAKQLSGKLEDLQAKMKAYSSELASRASDSTTDQG